MQILIHACPERMWFVNEFLLPELAAQGAEAPEVYNDAQRRGNLAACMSSFAACFGDGDTWHLQDDVWPARDFVQRIKDLETVDGILCGFVNEIAGPDANLVGKQKAADLWYSFPCIRIPDLMARKCAAWTAAGADRSDEAFILTGQGKGDDWFFKRFLELCHPEATVYHLRPCLVEHVDHLLGGSVTNPWRGHFSPAAYWDDRARIDELAKRIRERRPL